MRRKHYSSLIIGLFVCNASYAQNTAWPAANSSDQVGMGTATPTDKLHINNGSVFVTRPMYVVGQYNVEWPLIYRSQHGSSAAGRAGLYLWGDGNGGYSQASGLAFELLQMILHL